MFIAIEAALGQSIVASAVTMPLIGRQSLFLKREQDVKLTISSLTTWQ
jgi:hypothetical protein